MTKTFFTKASPKAVEGIRRAYANTGAEVRAKIGSDGSATVVVMMPDRAGNKVAQPRGERNHHAEA